MSGNNKEIPGFYRDPVTGKYYRDAPGSSHNSALKKLKIEREVIEEFKIKPNVSNTNHFFNAREIGAVGGLQGTKEYLKMRWHLKKQIENTVFDVNFGIIWRRGGFSNNKLDSVNYIIGSRDSIYGFWENKRYPYVIGAMKLKEPSQDLYFHRAFGFVIDMCEGIDDDFVVLYNLSSRNGLLAECVDEYDRRPILQSGQTFASRTLEIFDRQIFCCCCNKNRLCYAFGCENAVGFMDANNREDYIKVNGRIHTVAFDDTGNLMTAGVHTGKLFLYDLRTKEMVMKIAISKASLVDSSVVNAQHIVISGADDVLCSVDIRKKEVVTEFFTHKQQGVKKEPLSIANNMLCALGSDNRIRIWDFSGGFPIHKISPLENPQNKIKGWLCNIDNKTCLCHFEGGTKKTFRIM